MTYTLYGSKTSPFVRRIRILLNNMPYTFKEIDVFGKDADLLNYLNKIHKFQILDWKDENLLTAIPIG
jgi:glutathione S-transferase